MQLSNKAKGTLKQLLLHIHCIYQQLSITVAINTFHFKRFSVIVFRNYGIRNVSEIPEAEGSLKELEFSLDDILKILIYFVTKQYATWFFGILVLTLNIIISEGFGAITILKKKYHVIDGQSVNLLEPNVFINNLLHIRPSMFQLRVR